MTLYVWRDGIGFVDKKTGERMVLEHGDISCPAVISDLPAYMSPLGTGMIDGRAARREDLKRNNCREVDPSEYRPKYLNENFARKHGKTVER